MKTILVLSFFLYFLSMSAQEKKFIPPSFDLPKNSDFNPKVLMKAKKPITDVKFISVAEANKIINPDDLVIGVNFNGDVRAYPISMLTGPHREIFNENIDGKPIAITW